MAESIPLDIICFEIPRHMDGLFELVHLSRVCKRLYETWKTHVKEIPLFKQVINFPITSFLHLEVLNISSLESYITEPINNEYVSQLKLLKWLKMGTYFDLVDDTISNLSNLTYLHIFGNSLSDNSIRTLTKLTTLNLGSNSYISDNGISKLTSLTSLTLSNSFIPNGITDNGISNLTSLTYLNLENNRLITSKGLAPLTLLREFHPGYNNCITDTIQNILTNTISTYNITNQTNPNDSRTLSMIPIGHQIHFRNNGTCQLKIYPTPGTRIDMHDIDAYTTIDVGRSVSYMFGNGTWYTVGIW